MQILVTNDDGVQSEGILRLADALRRLGRVTIVAPVTESSAIGHALTLRRPLRIEPVREGVYAVDGTPTDCVNLAVTSVIREVPALVVSGINKGFNIGDDITYSGTVAGALEAALLGIPAIAVSLQGGPDFDFEPAAQIAASVAETLLRHPLPGRTFLNVNVPRGELKGIRTTVQARRNHITAVTARVDPRGREYYWIDEAQDDWEPHDRSDYQAVRDGWVSVTPLHPDLTAYQHLKYVDAMGLDLPSAVRQP
ncbi:MAG TPA: 5'/3'-nucleotidase SurE [Vicinamibacterales bacterium]|nr:5'/3'-nucleotidase SurE [Vicinamibacterales bacterium]